MKISTRKDIDAPVDAVFAAISDFSRFEHRARARGASVERLDTGASDDSSATWTTQFDFRSRTRICVIRVVTYEPAGQLAFKFGLDGLTGLANIELMALSPERTRLFLGIQVKPNTMTARLLLQSLKVAKGSLTRRLDKRLDTLAEAVEKSHRAAT